LKIILSLTGIFFFSFLEELKIKIEAEIEIEINKKFGTEPRICSRRKIDSFRGLVINLLFVSLNFNFHVLKVHLDFLNMNY